MKVRLVGLFSFLGGWPAVTWAFDSYRYLHVTIETPWMIFLFLLPVVLSPFILMVILYWRFAGKRTPRSSQSPAASRQNP